MNIKQFVVMVTAVMLSVSVSAQSLEEGIKMYKYERYKSAKEQLSSLAGSNPLANYYLGLSELQLGNVTEAKQIFNKYPEDYANMSGLARVAFVTGNATTGNQIAENIAKKAKKKDVTPYKYAADAITYTKGGDKNKAIEWYNLFLERQILPDVKIALGDAYQSLQSGGGKAMSSYEDVVATDASNSLALSRIGKLWYDAKRYDLALENWNKAQEADASNPLPYRDLADAYRLTGKYQLAKENIEKYWSFSDKSNVDKEKYMDILFLSEDYSGAIEKARELINAGVVEPRFYGILAFSQLELKDSANALKNIRKYIEQTPKDDIRNIAYLKYGSILLTNSMNDSADRYFNLYAQNDTSADKSSSYRDIAQAFKKQKAYKQTAKWYEKLTSQFADKATPTDYFYSGYYYYFSQDFGKADSMFANMEEKHPDQPSAPYWRGRINMAIDSLATEGNAVPHYEKWLGIEQDNYTRKDKDLKYAYEYLLLYNYKKQDKENTNKYMALLEAIDPENRLVGQIKEIQNKN